MADAVKKTPEERKTPQKDQKQAPEHPNKNFHPKKHHSSRRRSRSENPKLEKKAKYRAFSEAELATRADRVPPLIYPAELPVTTQKERIAEAIRTNQVVIIAGETGSGKTTQLPKICLEIGRGIHGMIGHTQPRRIAARSVAERIAKELKLELGGIIGYQVRFTEMVSHETLIKLMTDGILLAEIQTDPLLRKYDTIIIDEAHERSLNIDFLLGYLAQILPQRPDLKLIITSATIDSKRFAKHFGKYSLNSAQIPNFPQAQISNSPQAAIIAAEQSQSANTVIPAQSPKAKRDLAKCAPIIEVSGRTFPVEIRYRPLDGSHNFSSLNSPNSPQHNNQIAENYLDTQPQDQISGIIAAAAELILEGPGDILVFLSGEGEIRETQKAFQEELGAKYIAPGESSKIPGAIEVLPLFARLSAGEQHRIFTKHNHRRIILATNIAETSLTVPGIRYVIDPGTARISRYSNKTKVQRLPIEPISQASANQRAGRCGRVSDGIAIRLYSEEDFNSRPKFTEPEIQRTSLAAVILQMTALNLGEIADFPFIDPPDVRSVRAGMQLLEEIGALEIGTHKPRLTKIGRQLARLPIDPRLGRMLLAANENGCGAEVLVLTAAMTVQDVRERPLELKTQADQLHARFIDPSSDFLAYLNLWRYLRTQQRELSGSGFRKMCRSEYLHWLRFREWEDVVTQLQKLARPLGITLQPINIPSPKQLAAAGKSLADEGKDLSHNRDVIEAVKALSTVEKQKTDQIHRSLLPGMLSNLGNWDERKHDYLGARGTHFVIWPGSGLYKRTPAWVMAAELVETSRLFARTVARIDSDWIEKAAVHLVKYNYSEPYWSTRNGAAMVHQKVMLYGMTIVADRPALLSKIGTPDAQELARELFIRHGLIENQWRAHHKFIKYNAQQLQQAREVETRLRQYGLVADENAQFAFFNERLPQSIVSGRHFDSWWKKEQRHNPDLLNFTQDFLLGNTHYCETDYPQKWVQGEIELPITYAFQLGAHADGLSIKVPVTLLPQLKDEGFDWLVPGLLPELVQSTIRALPKSIRRNLVPAPDVARQILALLPDWHTAAKQPLPQKQRESISGDFLQNRISDMAEFSDLSETTALSFQDAFTAAVRKLKNFEIPAEIWREISLPPHLQIKFVVYSERGAVLDESPSLSYLQRTLAVQTRAAMETVMKGAVAQALDTARAQLLAQESLQHSAAVSNHKSAALADVQDLSRNIDNLCSWPQLATGALPEVIETEGVNGAKLRGYPALVEVYADLSQETNSLDAHKHSAHKYSAQKVSVSLRVLSEPALQVREHKRGVIRLLTKELALPEGRIISRWNAAESLLLAASPYPNTSALTADLQLTAVRNIAAKWAKEHKTPLGRLRLESEYFALRKYLKDRIEDEIYRIAQICARIFSAWSEVNSALDAPAAKSAAMINTVEDVSVQIRSLIYDGFIYATPDSSLLDLIRYLQGAKYRIEKAPENIMKDEDNSDLVAEAEDLLFAELEAFKLEKYDASRANTLEQGKWLIQELRISLFAQPLGTKTKVSLQRIRKLLAA